MEMVKPSSLDEKDGSNKEVDDLDQVLLAEEATSPPIGSDAVLMEPSPGDVTDDDLLSLLVDGGVVKETTTADTTKFLLEQAIQLLLRAREAASRERTERLAVETAFHEYRQLVETTNDTLNQPCACCIQNKQTNHSRVAVQDYGPAK